MCAHTAGALVYACIMRRGARGNAALSTAALLLMVAAASSTLRLFRGP